MKKNISIFLATILIFLFTSLTSFAISHSEDIRIYYNNIKLFINNEKINLESEPFIYQDTIFIPLRSVSEAMGSIVNWDSEKSQVSIMTYKDFSECDPLKGERFVYGEITSINKFDRTLDIFQHLDDNSLVEEKPLKVSKDVIIILKRNDKKINLDFDDLKISDGVGMVVNSSDEVRGIIIEG